MYHPGKVLEVFNPKDKKIKCAEGTTQAIVEMWDENMFTFLVAENIAQQIKPGDIALVDYRIQSEKIPIARQTIIKILEKDKGKKVWNTYKEYHQKKQDQIQPQPKMPGYMG